MAYDVQTKLIYPNLDWRRVLWNALWQYLIVLSGGRREIFLLIFAVLGEMLEEGFQGWAACDQLPSVTFPPKSTLDVGPQLLWLVQATDSMIPKSPSGTIYQLTRLWGICVQPTCHWQKFSCTIRHTYAHPGTWQEWLGKAAAHFPQESEQLRCEQLLTIWELGMQKASGLSVPTANS